MKIRTLAASLLVVGLPLAWAASDEPIQPIQPAKLHLLQFLP